KNVQAGGGADPPTGNHAKFAVVNHRDLPLRMLHHCGVELGFLRDVATNPPLRIDSVSANEERMNQQMRETLRGGWSHKREPVSAQMPSGDENVQVLAL